MKVNFYNEVESGMELIKAYPTVADDNTKFMVSFKSVFLDKPEGYATDVSAKTRHDRRVAVYHCILHRAGFTAPAGFKVKWEASADICAEVQKGVSPASGLTPDEACTWWENLWRVYDSSPTALAYRQKKGKEWADDDLKALLIMLTRCRSSGGTPDCNGYRNLRPVAVQHTPVAKTAFEQDILEALRDGKIVIADLSSGDEELQRMYSERITWKIFRDSMARFTSARPNNFIQFYFEEAHNLFPKKEDKDLSQVYNRLAKEGAKLHLGLVYATQEVSSISGNILKATQNWFISHLNNEDEIKELRKYYDFSDFSDSLVRFSQDTDKGFVRVKTYSNAFVVPVQIDKFAAKT